VNLVRWILEIALVFATPTSVEGTTPSFRIRDGDGVLVEVTALLASFKRVTSSVLGLEEAVVWPALSSISALLHLERDPQFPEHRPDELLFELGLIPLRGGVLLTLPEIHNVIMGLLEFFGAYLVPFFGLGEVFVEVVVREQITVRTVGECCLHLLGRGNDEEFVGIFAIDDGVRDLFGISDVHVNFVADFDAEFLQFRPGDIHPA